MKLTVNKKLFLDQALPIIDFDRISLAGYGGVLAVASFGNTVNFRVPAHVVEPGQVFLTIEQWRDLVAEIKDSPGSMADIEL
ncbi:hypothetical protein SRRS_46300 [Sporomusa rhizae]|uniref:hypothetical protein n=1 Tax=Sporomusa rhizae TaxID=357999 RepID=UPI00352A7E9A